MPPEPYVGRFRRRPQRGEAPRAGNPSRPTTLPAEGARGRRGRAGRAAATSAPVRGATSRPASAHPPPRLQPRPRGSLPSGSPSFPWATPRTRAGRGGGGAVRAVGTVAPNWSPPEPGPGPARRGLAPDPRARRVPRGQASAPPTGPAPSGAALHRRLTSNVSKAHVRRRSTDVSAPLAWPGPPSRSAPLPSAAQSSTPRTSAPGSSPTRQGPPGCPRPFCDARGRGPEHARERARGRGGAAAGMASRGVRGTRRAGPGALTSGWRRPLRRRPRTPRFPQKR